VGRFLTVPPERVAVLARSDANSVTGVAMSQGAGTATCIRVVAVDELGVTLMDVAVRGDHVFRLNRAAGALGTVTVGGAPARTRRANEGDPASGWQSLSYADRRPTAAVEADLVPGRPLVTTVGQPSPERHAVAIALADGHVPAEDLATLRHLGD
jgi:hypothetical protein